MENLRIGTVVKIKDNQEGFLEFLNNSDMNKYGYVSNIIYNGECNPYEVTFNNGYSSINLQRNNFDICEYKNIINKKG